MMEIQARYTDPKLKNVRDYVGAKYSKTPFLLMPVRIETRFMKPERSDTLVSDAGLMGLILEDVYQIETAFLNFQKKPKAKLIRETLQIFSRKVKQVQVTMGKIERVTKAQKKWLEEALSSVVKEATLIEGQLSNRVHSSTFKKELQTLVKLGKDIDASAPSKMEAALSFAQEMTALERQLALWSNGKIPFTSHEKKKQLYGYVSDRIADVGRFYEGSTDKVLSIGFVEANWVQKIKGLHHKIKGHLEKLERSVKPIHDDENWINFMDAQISFVRQEYAGLFTAFEKTAITHLEEIQKKNVVDANELLVQCFAIKKSFRALADTSEPSYGNIKLFRKHLKGKMSILENLEKKVIAGNESQKNQIAQLLGEIETERSKLDQKLGKLSFKKSSQQYGLKTTRQTISKAKWATLTLAKTPENISFFVPKKRSDELWLRVYPDDILVHTHEKSMTQGEMDSAKRYWKIVWAVDADKELVLGAWRSMVSSYGSNRAAWIIKTVGALKTPINRNILLNNPSKAMGQAYGQLVAVQQVLEKLKTARSIGELEGKKVNFSEVKAQLDAATAIYKQRKDQPQLIYFLEKAIRVQQRLHTRFQQLIEVINKPTIKVRDKSPIPEKKQALLVGQVQAVIGSFQALNAAFKALKAMRTDQFLAYISEPYAYPDSPLLQAKAESWTVAPHSRALPKQFVAVGRNQGRFEIIHVGNLIPDSLQIGMNPATFNFDAESDNPFQFDENGDLQVEEGMRWMVDFKEAVKKGMGMIIPLTPEQARKGFDELYVVGLNDQTATQDAAVLEELLENHHYAATGLEFLKIGTPTNNTEGVKAGYSEQGLDADSAYALEMEGPLFDTNANVDPLDRVDGQHLAHVLGISAATFAHIKNSERNQIGQAKAMHRSLWHATLGVYMEDMWDKVFTYDNIERTYQFFTQYVVGRGYLPSLRMGSQPYGILPVTSYKHISFKSSFTEEHLPALSGDELRNPDTDVLQQLLQFRYDVRLKTLLNEGHRIWSSLRKEHVNHAGNMESKADPQAAFIDMLGLNATSVEHYFRYGVNVNDRTADNLADVGINFKQEEAVVYGPQSLVMIFHKLLKAGYYQPSFEWDDEMNPSVDVFKQTTRQNARMKDQVQDSRIFTYRYFNRHSLVGGDLVSATVDEQPLPMIGDSKNYIQWLLDPSKHIYHDIFNDNNVADLPSQSILFLLLRQSMLLSYRQTAMDILQKDGFFDEPFRRLLGAKESYMARDLYRFRTKWTHLLKRIKDIKDAFYFNEQYDDPFDQNDYDITQKPLYRFLTTGGSESVSDYIHRESFRNRYSGHAQHQKFIDRNEEVKDAIRRLEYVPTEDLQKLLAEHLDASSYRLDAWLSGFANRRLEESRALHKKGVFLGAYAWVTDLRPGGERKKATVVPKGLAKNSDTVFTDEDNEGYIHAPSINHAISAAVLRSGYLANTEVDGNLSNRMAVNLSSARVRKALRIIDGLRNGLDLASLLGYQLEKGLHERYEEAELDKFIYPLRARFPLIIPVEVQAEEAPQHAANVVHGLDLLESITDEIEYLPQASQNSLFEYLTWNNFERCPAWLMDFVETHGSTDQVERTKELTAVIKEIDGMADTFDALGDIAISESVYQIVNGNHVRAASMLTALADGKRMPDPQIVDTPRTGVVVTHRVILPMEDGASTPAGWEAAGGTPRSKAEPSINQWLATKIGDPADYFCQVREADTNDTFRLLLNELPIQPIDLLFLLSDNREKGNVNLTDLIKDTVRYREGLTSEAVLLVDITEKNESWPEHARTFYELDWLLHQCKSILHDARPIGFSDIQIPPENPSADNPDQYDLADTEARVGEIHADLKQFIDRVTNFMGNNPILQSKLSFQKAYQQLLDATQYGVTNLLADLTRKSDAEEAVILLERLQKVVDLLEKRDQEASERLAKSEQAVSTHQRVQDLVNVVKKVLGEDFPFIPVFKNGAKEAFSQQLELSESESLLRAGTRPFPMEEWMQGMADVRSKIYSLEMLRMFERQSDGHLEIEPQPVQFPYRAGDYWLGMEFPDDFDAEEDRLSLLLLHPASIVGDEKQKGLLIDEWVEIIPNKKHTTGVAFQYDQPDARPPQTILLAVSPKPVTAGSKWQWDDLVYTLMDTLEMAKNRAVEPDHLEQSVLGQVLPAIVSEIVPPQIRSVLVPEDDVHQNPLGTQVVLDYEANLPKKEN